MVIELFRQAIDSTVNSVDKEWYIVGIAKLIVL